MKKVISILLVMALLTAALAVSFNALSVSDVDPETGEPFVMSVSEGVAAYEEAEGMEPGSLGTQRVYFQMPNGKTGPVATTDVNLHHPDEIDPDTGEIVTPAWDEIVIHKGDKAPSWYNENNIYDGKHYAGIYWWGGPAEVDGKWVGYRMEIENYEQGIYYADIPYDPDDTDASVVVAIFNNGVDGGTDSTKPIYYQAAQTNNTNVEGAWPGDYDSLPNGTPDEFSFDNCIYVIDPDQVSINAFSNKQECGANWYIYYGNGCYGKYFEGCDEYTGDVNQDCCNPDHFKNGVHVGYQPDDDPTEPAPTEPAPTEPAPTEPAPTEPAPTEPAPTEPKPTVAPTEPDPTEPAVTGKLGDADGDGKVTVFDVTVIQRVLASKPISASISTEVVNKLGDVDKDGRLTSIDVTILQRWLVGLEQNRGIGANV